MTKKDIRSELIKVNMILDYMGNNTRIPDDIKDTEVDILKMESLRLARRLLKTPIN